MYDRPELAAAHRRYWSLIHQGLARRGQGSPTELSQTTDEFSVWTDDHLILSQTCGLPYRLWLYKKVSLVGTPDYGLEHCRPGYYRSALIVHRSDQRTALGSFKPATDSEPEFFAYNQIHSQSGYAAARNHLSSFDFWFRHRLQTGQHLNSARAVATKRAAIASIDAVSWRLICRYEEFAANLRVLAWTEPTPGLPYICSPTVDSNLVFEAVSDAIAALAANDRASLGIEGIVRFEASDYLSRVPANPGATSNPGLPGRDNTRQPDQGERPD